MKTLAIDFETANEERGSACAMGLAWIENGTVTRREYRLIRPKEMRFNRRNITIHGIRPDDVWDKPEFPDVMSEFLPDIIGSLVVAHSASFDIEVMCATLRKYNESYPNFSYICTMLISQLVWPDLAGSSLDIVADRLGILFRHHHASEDAFASAQVALAAARELGVGGVTDIPQRIALHPGSVRAHHCEPCSISSQRAVTSNERLVWPALRFLVEGSSGNEYEIIASRTGRRFRMTCTCTAGKNTRYCKHRHALLNGETDDLISENESDLAAIPSMLAGTEAEWRLKKILEIERTGAEDKASLTVQRSALAQLFGRSGDPQSLGQARPA